MNNDIYQQHLKAMRNKKKQWDNWTNDYYYMNPNPYYSFHFKPWKELVEFNDREMRYHIGVFMVKPYNQFGRSGEYLMKKKYSDEVEGKISLLVSSQLERQRRSIYSFPFGPRGDSKQIANNPKPDSILLSQIQKFKAGDILYVIMTSPEITGKMVTLKQSNYIGICIKSSNKELSRSITLRNIIHGNAVEISFPIWSSNIKGIFRIGKKKSTSSRLYYLRYKSNRFSRVKNKSFIQNINVYNHL